MHAAQFAAVLALGSTVATLGVAWWGHRRTERSRRAVLRTLRTAVVVCGPGARGPVARGQVASGPGERGPGAGVAVGRGLSAPGRGEQAGQAPSRAAPRSAGLLARCLAGVAGPLTPPRERARTARRLALAGLGNPRAGARFLAVRSVCAAAVVPAVPAVLLAPGPDVLRLMGLIGLPAVLLLGPEAWLARAVEARKQKVLHELPTFVELLLVSVEAGLGLDQAVSHAVTGLHGPLGAEMGRYLAEARMGASRQEAFEAVDRRTGVEELRAVLRSLAQSETMGVALGPMLRSQATDARAAQAQRAREQAGKAPVKMLFPLVFCVMPALFVVVLGPAGIEVFRMLSRQ